MSLFQQCPKKYYHLRIVKDIVEPPSEQMRYGLMAHKVAEDYIRDGTPIHTPFSYMQEALDKLKNTKGDIYCEHKMGLTYDLEPCKFMAKDAWWRGIADLLVVNGEAARIVDYKTGSARYPDPKQLKLMALMTYAIFPKVERIKGALLFVAHDAFVFEDYKRDAIPQLWAAFDAPTLRLSIAYERDLWPATPTPLCGWCPVSTCEFQKER